MTDQLVNRRNEQASAAAGTPRRMPSAVGERQRHPRPMPVLDLSPLPVSLTSFVGREGIAATIDSLLRQPENRLLTLTGPGGVGKTRLAVKVADGCRACFADGVGFVALAALRDPGLVLPAIAACLGLRNGDRTSLLDRVQAHLAGRHCLLVLDNFEQVVDAGPTLIRLLNGVGGLHLLVTSRMPLRVSGERVVTIPPMALPATGTEAEVIDSEAVQLFLDRAKLVRPDITLTETATPAIAEICARLDGLPLAIELAAAKSPLFSPPAMRDQLVQRLPLLTSGPRDQPQRLQTMRAAIAWSYDLLEPADQELFRCLGVCSGGFSLETAVAMCERDTSAILTGLEALVDHSLVQAMSGPDDEPRYTMLETIREFGRERLVEHREVDQAHARHTAYFLALAERIGHEVDGPEARDRLSRLDFERLNLEVAAGWLTRQGDAARALRLAAALWHYWRIRGYLEQGRDILAAALALGAPTPPVIRADALWKLGYLQFFLGECSEAQSRLEQSVELFVEAGNRAGEAIALDSLGTVLLFQGQPERARPCHERALAIRRELGDRVGVGMTLVNIGMLELYISDITAARALVDASLRIARESGSSRDIANRLLSLGQVEFVEGQVTAAREHVEQARVIFDELGDQISIVPALTLLGQVAGAFGDHAAAIDQFLASLQLRLKLGLYRNLGDFIERVVHVVVVLDAELAARYMGAAAAERETTGVARLAWDEAAWSRSLVTAKETLGEERFKAAWLAGRELTIIAAAHEAATALAEHASTYLTEGTGVADPGLPDGPVNVLSPRELEILQLVAAGHTNREIASTLFISPATVKRHVTNIFARIGVSTRAAAISYALQHGLLDD